MIARFVGAVGAAVAAAVGSALCCVGPLAAVALGVSTAGLSRAFSPWQPVFIAATVLALGYGYWRLEREERAACEPGRPCASPRARRVMRRTFWAAVVLAAVVMTVKWWSAILI